IIMDSPPLMSVTDAAVLATRAEGVLLIVKAEAVPRKAAMEARDQLLEVKAPLLGTLLNDVPVERDGYYYYHYYYRYRTYYSQEGEVTPRRRRQTQARYLSTGPLAWLKGKTRRRKGQESLKK
ncbi:MAG: hypothetical protein JRI66_12565, partial [Deltaproteobacteria bacterium]|nr:hypothetical protein [Deltaproteobacteria bacterium]